MKTLSLALLLLLAATVLGATVLREPIADAAPAVLNVFVTNDGSNPVPVREQGSPTVAIRPTANGVTSVDTNRVLYDEIIHLSTASGDIEIGNAKQIRVYVNVPGDCGDLAGVIIRGEDASGNFLGNLGRPRAEGFCSLSHVIDLPAPKIKVFLEGSSGGLLDWRLVVMGRAN